MSKRIEEILNLPKLTDAVKELDIEKINSEMIDDEDDEIPQPVASEKEFVNAVRTTQDYNSLKASTEDLSLIEHDKDMDKIADEAFKHHETFMDLCANTDPRQAEAFVTGATQMLRLSFDAKKEKQEKRMRVLKYKLDKERLEMQKGNQEGTVVDADSGGSVVIDRNELLDRMIGKK